MGFRPSEVSPDFSSLIVSLDNSKTQVTNYALYQTIFFLIQNTAKARDLLQAAVKDIDELVTNAIAGSFLTVNDETAVFPNSRRLLAGTGITFDDTVPKQRTINASGAVIGAYYDSPLTDGDLDETDLIFGSGDPIIVQVPNVP